MVALTLLVFLVLYSAVSIEVQFFDLNSAVTIEQLSYEEQLLAYVFQGLVNDVSLNQPQLMFNAAYLNFDWPGSDMYWNQYFTEKGRVTFKNFTNNTICGLV